ncbi:MAG TPA: SHOCT domain-containing protein [Acidimicrobiales bacterium]|nr:SHOCT domain-containing protein [Acidimicrobiales bacterium]
MIATSYPLLDAFLTMLWIFLFIIWIWLLIMVFGDIFRSRDLSGWGKGLWTIGIIIFPWLGVLIYLIARGGKMHERQIQAAQASEQAFRQYVQETAATSSTNTADQLAKLADLRDKGVISDAEFQTEKAKVLASS